MSVGPGVAVLDIDGVILRGQLIVALARRAGVWPTLRTVFNCLRFDKAIISLEQLLDSVYSGLAGTPVEAIWDIYRRMTLTPGSDEAVAELKAKGWTVLLLSSGVPHFIVQDLVERLDADGGAGIDLETRDGRLTGEFGGELVAEDGKRAYIDRWLGERGATWNDVVVVGDDRNNLTAMRAARVSIGFAAMREVRRDARFLVDTPDLRAILPLITEPPEGGPDTPPSERHPVPKGPWRREVFRKLVHATTALVPLIMWLWEAGVPLLLMAAAVIYVTLEDLRLNGFRVPLLWWIQANAMRRAEARHLALGPLTLALGVGVSMVAFERPITLACILTVAFADSAACLVGGRWGRIVLPYSRRKTLEGLTAGIVVAVACGLPFVPVGVALTAGIMAGVVESLNLRDWDNFWVPVVAGTVMTCLIPGATFGGLA